MALWLRSMLDKSCRLSLLYRRWYNSLGYGTRNLLSSHGSGWPVYKASEESGGVPAHTGDGVQYMSARFFAAPIQARTKGDTKAMQGPRLNEAITAKFIRLVTDEGHAVVSREEALDRARRLDLDLVEVQQTGKPPVCKIMDYYKAKYKKETMEKERAKSKSESTVRKGDFKEVRLKGNIEQKDIEVKAETVRGLIERGYRVKCMALPSKQRGTEECNLGTLLSRLTDLIEDVITIESGPFVERQQAYVVVRHVKFSSKKGSRKKASKAVETTSEAERFASTVPLAFESAILDVEAVESMDKNEEMEDEVLSDREDDAQDLPSNSTTSPLIFDSDTNRNVIASRLTGKRDSLGVMMSDVTEMSLASTTVNSSMKAKLGSERDQMDGHGRPEPNDSLFEFPSVDSNRYSRRIETKLRPDQTNPTGRSGMTEAKATPESCRFSSTDESNKFNRSLGVANSRWVQQQRPNLGNIPRQPPSDKNQKHEALNLNRGHLSPIDSSPPPSYGIFSSPKHSRSDDQRRADADWDKDKNPLSGNKNVLNIPKSKVETTGQSNDETKQGGWGVFSRPIANPSQGKSSGHR